MAVLFKKLLRDFNEAKGQFTAILIIVAIGVMFYTGINATFRNLSEAKDKYYKKYRFEDIHANLYYAPENIVQKVKQEINGVKMADGRIVQDVKMYLYGKYITVRIVSLPDSRREMVNDIVIKSGRYFSGDESNQCLIEEQFFKANNLSVGNMVKPIINGMEVKLKVVGKVASPEYIYPVKDGSEIIPDYKKFGIIYVKKSFAESIFGMNGSINNICLTIDEGINSKDVKDKLDKLTRKSGIKEIVERKDQLSNRMISDEIRQLMSSGSSFPIVFLLVAAAIIYIVMGRIVENQRTLIGVMKAMGYGNFQVLSHYLLYSIIVGVAGSVIGSILGLYFGMFLTRFESQYFNLPLSGVKMYTGLIIPASIITLFFCILAGYNSCKAVFGIMPAEAMKAKPPKTGREIFIEKIGILWNKFDFSLKMTIRNIFRYKKRAALTSIGIIFATGIVLVGLCVKNSIDYAIDMQYLKSSKYDIKVDFTKFLNSQEIKMIRHIPHVVKLEPLVETGIEISNGWRKKDIGLTAVIDNPELFIVVDEKGNTVRLPPKGIMISEKLKRILGTEVGENLSLKPYIPNKDDKNPLTLKGIVPQFIGLNAYCSYENIKGLIGEGDIANSAVLKIDDVKNQESVMSRLKDIPVAGAIQSKNDTLKNVRESMEVASSFTGIMLVVAIILAMAVIYNITTINIFERQKELVTLKVLGFKDSEINRVVFNENILITVFGIILGLPFGRLLGVIMTKSNETEFYSLPAVFKASDYITAAVLVLICTILTNFILSKKIKILDMVEIMKSRE